MKRFFSTILSTAAVCAFLSTTPVAAQETIIWRARGHCANPRAVQFSDL